MRKWLYIENHPCPAQPPSHIEHWFLFTVSSQHIYLMHNAHLVSDFGILTLGANFPRMKPSLFSFPQADDEAIVSDLIKRSTSRVWLGYLPIQLTLLAFICLSINSSEYWHVKGGSGKSISFKPIIFVLLSLVKSSLILASGSDAVQAPDVIKSLLKFCNDYILRVDGESVTLNYTGIMSFTTPGSLLNKTSFVKILWPVNSWIRWRY